jgi:tetratricopeptide (TPR) repeat protein
VKLSQPARGQIGAEAIRCLDEASLGHAALATKAAHELAANPDLSEDDAMVCLPGLRTAHRADLVEAIFSSVDSRQALSPAGLRILGLAQEAGGKLQPARATLEKAFSADSGSMVVLVDLTRVAEAENDHSGALGYLAHARELQPADASLPFEFGVICLQMDLYGEARKAITEALKLAPDNPDYNYEMGVIASIGNDPAEAIPFLTKYHNVRPNDSKGMLALGESYFRARDFDTASKWLTQAVPDPAAAADAHFFLGRIARQEGRFDDATAQLKQSLALHSDSADALAELGQIYLTKRNYSEAAPCFNRALALDRDNYAANFGLLQLYARTDDQRRDQQSRRFDEVKDKKDLHDRERMRTIEIRPDPEAGVNQ